MKRILSAAAVTAATAALALSTAVPASAAPGRLYWTFGDEEIHTHDNPAKGCYTIAADDSMPTDAFHNGTVEAVTVSVRAACTGPFADVYPGRQTSTPVRSYYVYG